MSRSLIRALTVLALLLTTVAAEAQATRVPAFQVRREALTVQRADGASSSLAIYLPLSAAAARPTALFIHGFGAPPRAYTKAAESMASQGYAVALFDQINIFDPDLRRWISAGSLALDALLAANADPNSAIFGEIDTARIACVGHSYGSITALGLSATDPRVKAVVLWAPGASRGDRIPVEAARQAARPTLVIASQFDHIAPTSLVADPVWENLSQQQRLFLEIKDASHNNYLDFTLERFIFEPRRFRLRQVLEADKQRAIALRYTQAWLDKYLRGLPDLQGLTDGRFAKKDPDLSRVLTP